MRNTEAVYEYFENKYGCGYLGLVKALSVASMFVGNKDVQPLSVLIIAPSGQFKSRTTIELLSIFCNKDVLIDMGSDFTMHALHDKFEGGKGCDGKTLAINDMTLLFSSKSPRAKDRLVSGLAELLSEGVYMYGERNNPNMRIEASISIVANITQNSYQQNKKNFLDNTFIERLLPFFYALSDEQQVAFAREIQERKAMKFGKKIRLKKIVVNNLEEHTEVIIELAKQLKAATLSPSLVRCIEKIRSMICSMCVINRRNVVQEEDLVLVRKLLPFFSQGPNKDADIVRLHLEGKSVEEIAEQLHLSKNHPYKIISKYKERGILS